MAQFYLALHRAYKRFSQVYLHAVNQHFDLNFLHRVLDGHRPLPSGSTLELTWLHHFGSLYSLQDRLQLQIELAAAADDFLYKLQVELATLHGANHAERA